MPKTTVIFYAEADGSSPVFDFLQHLRERKEKAFAKCMIRLERLEALGHELRRPEADLLRDGIYELRIRLGTVNYRILYFFVGKQIAVVAHAITKEAEVPRREIDIAIERMTAFLSDPKTHSFAQPTEPDHDY